MLKTVIMAGGKGTRIQSIASDIPKPMIKIGGIPVLEREIECLRSQGFTDIILTVGHLSNIIIDYFGDGSKISPITGKEFGVNIKYFIEDHPLGNAGALFQMKSELKDDFLLLNADAIFDIDFKKFVNFHKSHGGLVTLFTHPNSHPYDSCIVVTDSKGKINKLLTTSDERPEFYKNRVNAGLHVISPKIFDYINPNVEKVDLDRQVISPLVSMGEVFAYDSPEYVKDMGTPDRYKLIEDEFKRGIVSSKNLKNKQKAFFIDRDGTINEYVGFLKKIDDFKLLPNVSSAIKLINSSNYLAIVITNQPVVARGDVTFEQLEQIHNKMETLLGKDGAYLDAIYYCPHHPDSGFEGEVKELKIKCRCRKPDTLLIEQACEKYNIDLNESYVIGDTDVDRKLAENANIKYKILTKNYTLYDAVKEVL